VKGIKPVKPCNIPNGSLLEQMGTELRRNQVTYINVEGGTNLVFSQCTSCVQLENIAGYVPLKRGCNSHQITHKMQNMYVYLNSLQVHLLTLLCTGYNEVANS